MSGSTITLTTDQFNAEQAVYSFITNPNESVMVLEGYSGVGKSTLVKHILNNLPTLLKSYKLICPTIDFSISLTATTNKAAENLAQLSGCEVKTVHSFFSLRLHKDYRTGKTTVLPTKDSEKYNQIIFIDEASCVDSKLLDLIFKLSHNCKIIFIGDPAQLIQFNSTSAPVFNAGFPTAKLTETMRNSGHILDVATMFRHTVSTGIFPVFKPDGQSIIHMHRKDFLEQAEKEFCRNDWECNDSKILAWTNNRTIAYNKHIQNNLKGTSEFKIGDYVIVNNFINSKGGGSYKTDEYALIKDIHHNGSSMGVSGNFYKLNNDSNYFFMPHNPKDKKDLLNKLKNSSDRSTIPDLMYIDSNWIDLRGAYSSTVNKAQGSTYERVFIDLEDISKCNSGNQIARMMYVAISRARKQVFLTGDFG